jgi:NAD+ diphosphatase
MDHMLYTAVALDRAHELRRDPKELAEMQTSAGKIVVPLWRDLSLIGTPPSGIFLHGTTAAQVLDLAEQIALLGLMDGRPVFAADISGVEIEAEADGGGPALGLGGSWLSLRNAGPALPAKDGGILAYARGLLLWHRRTRFCGSCGAPTESREGGHSRLCLDTRCATPHYPRTDPAVIMCVTDGDKVLLHRQPIWPPGMWSVLAGFVEPGEMLEEAVAREVLEETGIAVADVRYAGSQPWPFPSSLMIGFTARANGGTLMPCPHELEDARWFSRADIRRDFSDDNRDGGRPFLARPGTIARALLDEWLD